MKFRFLFALAIILQSTLCFSKNIVNRTYQIPVMLEPLLAGNFGELRPNHFHSGVDFKTKGTIGHPIYNCDDGWVSRIVVSPRGYGLAIYISHYNGLTTVYAHLDKFVGKIGEYVENYQYDNETFVVDTQVPQGALPVKRGEVVALSGNSGSSAGPHLHYEIRDTKTEEVLDPMPFFVNKIKDTTKPVLRMVRFYPLEGIVNNSSTASYSTNPTKDANGKLALKALVTAWGEIGIGIKAIDRMDSVYNTFGVKYIRLFQEDTLIFSIRQEKFSFDKTRYLNSMIDYKDWHNHRSMVTKLYREPGNFLDSYGKTVNDGKININEEKLYNFRLELADNHGNTTVLPFSIQGKKTELRSKKEPGPYFCKYDTDNIISSDNFWFNIPRGALYTNIDLKYTTKQSEKGHSPIHVVHTPEVPLHTYCEITIPVTKDNIKDKSKYFIASSRHGRPQYNSTAYIDGQLIAKVRTFGEFYAASDTVPPTLSPLGSANWGKSGHIRYRISDNLSGVKTWKGEIDGNFALFEFDEKVGYISYKIDKKRVERNKNHTIKMTLTDNCGNETVDIRNFYW